MATTVQCISTILLLMILSSKFEKIFISTFISFLFARTDTIGHFGSEMVYLFSRTSIMATTVQCITTILLLLLLSSKFEKIFISTFFSFLFAWTERHTIGHLLLNVICNYQFVSIN